MEQVSNKAVPALISHTPLEEGVCRKIWFVCAGQRHHDRRGRQQIARSNSCLGLILYPLVAARARLAK